NKINKKLRQKLYKDELKKNFKRIRGLLITIIFSLLLLSLSITLYTNKPVNIIQDNIVNFGYNLFEIGTYEENNKYYTNYVYFSEDYEKLLKNNVKVYPYLKSNNTLVKYNDDFNLKYLNIIFVDEFNFLFSLIYGNYPENDFEIIISDYVAEVLLKAHYYSNVKVATDLIGLTYTTQSNNFKIVGIYDTKYEKYIDNKNSLESEFFKFRDNYISAFASNISTFYQITNSINYVDTMLNSPFINIININEESKNKILYQIDSKNGLFVTTNYLKNLGYNIDSILNNPQGVYDDIDKELSLDTIWGRKTYNIIGIYDNENEESINMEIASIACYSENIWDLTANVGLVLDVTKANALDKCWNLNYNVMTKNIGIFKTIETIYNYSKNIVLVIGLVFFIIYIILFSSYVLFTIEDRRYFIGVLRSVGISKQNINRFFINNNIVISLLILLLSFIINFPLIKLSNKMLLINSSFNIILYQFNVFILVILMIFVLCINMLISFLAINKLNKKPIVSIVRNI
ncbi:MAG TPA: FtsX-like permease family protein, partial [Acholeplasmataceae bacterium]|nr:FtsX-like permease family protein [Acholeplasmataceae bacterium]